jgi:hypothetical protein
LRFHAALAKIPSSKISQTLMRKILRVYHLAEEDNWWAIRNHGLKSASDLIREAALSAPAASALEREQRLAHSRIANGAHLRDQKPMPASALKRCLVSIAPCDWYAMINARIFFWLDIERLNRQRKACEPRPQRVMTIDAERLLLAYGDRAAVTPINTGNARRLPAKRGPATFVPYQTWIESAWVTEAAALGNKQRPHSHQPVELTIVGMIPDINEYTLGVKQLASGERFEFETLKN